MTAQTEPLTEAEIAELAPHERTRDDAAVMYKAAHIRRLIDTTQHYRTRAQQVEQERDALREALVEILDYYGDLQDRDGNSMPGIERARALALGQTQDQQEAMNHDLIKSLAKRAHNCLCPFNHTDECDWAYEEASDDPWKEGQHYRWLNKYKELLLGTPEDRPLLTAEELDEILNFIGILRKDKHPAIHFFQKQFLP